MKIDIKTWIKTSRAIFLPASIIPFLIGVSFAFDKGFTFDAIKAVTGLLAVICLHLGANLLNDYHDYRTGADNKSPKYSSLFGGSRVIQNNIYRPQTILYASVVLFAVGFLLVLAISIITKNFLFIIFLLLVVVLAIEYSAPPLRLAYNRLGELTIFLLFGILLVTGGFYLMTQQFSLELLVIALPISFLITAVIVCNEIPDFKTDLDTGKYNLVSTIGVQRSYILYGLLLILALISLCLNMVLGLLPPLAGIIAILFVLAAKPFFILKNKVGDINQLIKASRLTITLHSLIGLSIILLLVL